MNTSKLSDQSVEEYSKLNRPSNVSLDEVRAIWETNRLSVRSFRERRWSGPFDRFGSQYRVGHVIGN